MTTQTTTISTISVKSRVLIGISALVFGVFLVFGTGFAGSNVLHNAAHDTRHATGFPCH